MATKKKMRGPRAYWPIGLLAAQGLRFAFLFKTGFSPAGSDHLHLESQDMFHSRRRTFLIGAPGAIACGLTAMTPRNAKARWGSHWWYRLVVPEIFRPSERVPAHSPVVIVGTGFGASVSALRLAQAGIPVTLLERGFDWPTNLRWRKTFTSDHSPDGRGYWFRTHTKSVTESDHFSDSFGGVVDVQEFENIRTLGGACVGGGSIVYNGVSLQPSRDAFDHLFGGRLDYDELDQNYYPLVRQMMRVSELPDDLYNKAEMATGKAWNADFTAGGFVVERCPSVFNWDVVRDEYYHRTRRSALVGESIHGNANGAKYDLTQSYLAQAKATGRAKICTGQQVESISYDGSRFVLEIKQIDPTGRVVGRRSCTCDRLIMGAGSMGSTKLLLKARESGALPELNDQIGQGWGANGDVTLARSGLALEGILQPGYCASLARPVIDGRAVALEGWYTAGVPVSIGVGGTLGVIADDNRGQLSYDPRSGKFDLHWPQRYNDEVAAVGKRLHARVLDATGATPGALFGSKPEANTSFTAHPLGGVVLGKAADMSGRVHGYPGLYVMDGAMIPGSTGGTNPSLTIAAVAERNIAQVIDEDF